jgi:hypothetical protein
MPHTTTPTTRKPRTFERYGAAKLHADRLSVPFKPYSPALGKPATAAEVVAVDGPLRPTADPADGLKPQRLWAVMPLKPGTAKASKLAEAAEARRDLRAILKPGAKVYTNLRHVSGSGMRRHISVHIAQPVGTLRDLTRLVARAMDDPLTKDGNALVVGGTGMDMGFHVVYNLGSTLYPDGYTCTRKRCRAPHDHAKGRQTDGGYAFRQEWV